MTTTLHDKPPAPPTPAKPQAAGGPAVAVARAVTWLASLRLTVALLGLSIFLVFVGSLAQVHNGIWSVMEDYFRTLIAFVDLRVFNVFLPADRSLPEFVLPYPGGWLLGGALLANLLAAHATRFHYSWKRSGILLTHLGIITLMLSELVTGLLAEEAQFSMVRGQTVNFAEDIREFELAVIDPSAPDRDAVWAIPESRLVEGYTIRDPALPVWVEVQQLYHNSEIERDSQPARALPKRQASGLGNEPVDRASAYVRLIDPATHRAGEPVLVSQFFRAGPTVPVAGKTYRLELRFKRIYKPYTVTLLDLKHEKYVGTTRPKNFQSDVRVRDGQTGQTLEYLIYMNHPLRYRGETMYQHQMNAASNLSVLQVVDNPGWLIPYISCAIVTLGLVVQFGISLTRFAGREAKR